MTSITEACFREKAFQHLQRLTLYNCPEVTEEALEGISSESLIDLDISGTSVSGKALLRKGKFRNLQTLTLYNCKETTDENIGQLSTRSLFSFDGSGTSITGESFKRAPFHSLQVAYLMNCDNIHADYIHSLPKNWVIYMKRKHSSPLCVAHQEDEGRERCGYYLKND